MYMDVEEMQQNLKLSDEQLERLLLLVGGRFKPSYAYERCELKSLNLLNHLVVQSSTEVYNLKTSDEIFRSVP